MPEEVLIEFTPPSEPKPFYKTKRGILALCAIILVILAAIFSWWLSTGKITSVAARLDTLIYTVGSDFPARIKNVYVMAGDQVLKDQKLASIESPEFAGQLQSATEELAKLRSMAGLPRSSGQEDSANLVEKEAASKLAQARFDEERLYKEYQNAANEHVASLIAMRSINMSNQGAYSAASERERAMRTRMQEALENFEKASKFRASLDQALTKIKMAILAARRTGGLKGASEKTATSSNTTFTGETDLISPAQGSVFRVNAHSGQVLQPGEAAFYILPEDLSGNAGRWIQAWFTPEDRKSVKIGQPVSIKFSGLNLLVSGRVEAIGENEEHLPETLASEPRASALTRTSGSYLQASYIPVRISLDDAAKTNSLEPGIAADCQIQTHYIIGNGWI